jgi:hypothetical protein
MERRSDTHIPAILSDDILYITVAYGVSVYGIEDIVKRGAQIESAEDPWREERKIRQGMGVRGVPVERMPRAHVLRVQRSDCAKARNGGAQLQLNDLSGRIGQLSARRALLGSLERIRQLTGGAVTAVDLQPELESSGSDVPQVHKAHQTVSRIEELISETGKPIPESGCGELYATADKALGYQLECLDVLGLEQGIRLVPKSFEMELKLIGCSECAAG